MRKDTKIVFSLTKGEAAVLDQAAESNGRSRSAFVREAVRTQSGMGPEKEGRVGSGWQRRKDRRVFG